MDNTPIIQLHSLTKTYHTGEVELKAVREVTLEIQRGDFVAIMGASGSGKSTLMNMLGCLDQPTSGSYLLDGAAVAGMNRRQLARLRNKKLGFIFQSFNLLARTSALENVELPMFYSKPLMPLRATRQRALVNSPELLLADEPTGNLDTRTSIEIMGIFQKLNDAGITILMVTHELDIAAYCKRIVVMRDGQLISDTRNEKRRLAQEERAALDQAEQKAKLA
jgi:putative ABC transport system ATP-binding protein